MIEALLGNILALDYPRRLLDIIVVCEADDETTRHAAETIKDPAVSIYIVNSSGPRTKPNALNAAMAVARGDIITVYDAEDRPDPAQLRAAAYALDQNPALAVVQAPLTYYNADENWLTRQFTLEYDALFHVWLPFLAKMGLPFPLGGTSNHIRRRALEQVGGWDAFNVTEDADLSFRFAAYGWELGYITRPTFEEAVNAWRPWRNQRSRWMKGYMQTWLTHMKQPLVPGGRRGLKRQLTLQLTLGTSLLAGLFHVPVSLLLAAVYIYSVINGTSISAPFPLLASLIFSYSAGILIGVVGALRTGRSHLMASAFTMPFYWAMLFIPAVQALWELFVKPFYWNKTEHGDRPQPAPQNASMQHLESHDA